MDQNKMIENSINFLQAIIFQDRELKAGYMMQAQPPRVSVESDLIAITFNSIENNNTMYVISVRPGGKFARVDYVTMDDRRIISRHMYEYKPQNMVYFNDIYDCIEFLGPANI